MRFLVSLSLVCGGLLAAACDAGSVDGPGGPGGPAADAAPINPEIQCTTVYEVTGDVSHDVAPVEGASCDPAGTWTVSAAGPTAGPEREACPDAPATASFTLVVTDTGVPGGRDYAVADQDDSSRTWEVRFADKSGSCSGTFQSVSGVNWSLHPGENGPDGPIEGSARYEIVE